MNLKIVVTICLIIMVMIQDKCSETMDLEIYQTSSSGDSFRLTPAFDIDDDAPKVILNPEKKFQTISGFGGAFTESSAYLLNQLSKENKEEILHAYFSEESANYSLTRTHINSCDFSLDHYSYAKVENDTNLEHFSIEPDKDDVIPMIKAAQEISKDGFKIIASPWTAPPWMKTNNDWNGGKLKPEYYKTWAKYFSKYIKAYQEERIDIWGITVENEPLGNNSNWESMHYTPEEMSHFVKNYLGPEFEKEELNSNILVYDQNRDEELKQWADVLLKDKELEKYIYGTAVHWYSSTNDWMPEALNYTHELAPQKHIIHTEACVDAEVPVWKNDAWYWKKEATDWGWDWAPEDQKHHHPKYVPVYRYARDIIGCLNSWVEGWIDWNMILDEKGGPNLAKNWCVAPVIVNLEKDEVYYTPLYYTLMHFSKFIRPGAKRIDFQHDLGEEIMVTAIENEDKSIVVVILNMTRQEQAITLELNDISATTQISGEAIQTIRIQPEQ